MPQSVFGVAPVLLYKLLFFFSQVFFLFFISTYQGTSSSTAVAVTDAIV